MRGISTYLHRLSSGVGKPGHENKYCKGVLVDETINGECVSMPRNVIL